jgi:hypothetical protein
MSNKRRKNQELNRLSAYLDQALSESEHKKLEARLAADPRLREKLGQLRKTKLALGHLTRLKAPRNFTLSPEMVAERQPRRQPLQMSLRLASALAAILLVVLFGAEFILGQIPQPELLTAEAPAMDSARSPVGTEPEPLIQWGPPGGAGGVGGYGGDASAMEEPILEMEAPQEEAPPEEPILEEELEAPSDTAEPEAQPEIQAEQGESVQGAAEKGDLILGINPEMQGEIIDSSQPADTAPAGELFPWAGFLHGAQIALALIAVGGGLALLILRKRSFS